MRGKPQLRIVEDLNKELDMYWTRTVSSGDSSTGPLGPDPGVEVAHRARRRLVRRHDSASRSVDIQTL